MDEGTDGWMDERTDGWTGQMGVQEEDELTWGGGRLRGRAEV